MRIVVYKNIAYRLTEHQFTPLRRLNEMQTNAVMAGDEDISIDIEYSINDHMETAIRKKEYTVIGFVDANYKD